MSSYTNKALNELNESLKRIDEEDEGGTTSDNDEQEEKKENIFLANLKTNKSKNKDTLNTINLLLAQREIDLERIEEARNNAKDFEREVDDLDRKLHYTKLELSNAHCEVENLKEKNKKLRSVWKEIKWQQFNQQLLILSNLIVNGTTIYYLIVFVTTDTLFINFLQFLSLFLSFYLLPKNIEIKDE